MDEQTAFPHFMKKSFHSPAVLTRAGLMLACALWLLCSVSPGHAFPTGRTTFKDAAPFVGASGVHSLTALNMDSLLTVEAWADRDATVPANLFQWWWIFGVDSGTGNGALIDGNESMTLAFDKSVGASMIAFLYSGGSGGSTNNLARLSISGFASDPGAVGVPYYGVLVKNVSYASGTVTFDYANDASSDYGQVMFSNPAASAGRTLKITGAVSPNGDATSWAAALFQVDVQEAFPGPRLNPMSISHNITNSYQTADGRLTVKGYADRIAVTPKNLGRYQDECFGVYGGPGGNVVDTNESLTLQFASGIGLLRLDTVYSSGEVSISGFASDPGLVDPSGGASGITFADGVLKFTMVDGGFHAFYFNNRAGSAGQTLRFTVAELTGNQFAIAGVSYASPQTVIGADIQSNVAPTYTTPNGQLTLSAYADTPGTVPVNIYENVDWFGIVGGGNNESIEGPESLKLQFMSGLGLAGISTRYTSGQVVLSGFASDPGFSDPSGTASSVSYNAGTLSYTFNASHAPELAVVFANLSASAGQSLSLHTDGTLGSQVTLTRVSYGTASVAPVSLSLVKSGDSVILSWPSGTLQEAATINGTYNDLLGVTSPYTNALSGGQKFFRVKVQ
jgi:hypothetical protein